MMKRAVISFRQRIMEKDNSRNNKRLISFSPRKRKHAWSFFSWIAQMEKGEEQQAALYRRYATLALCMRMYASKYSGD